MKINTPTLFFLLLIIISSGFFIMPSPISSMLLVENVNIITMKEKQVLQNQTVLIEGNRIKSISSARPKSLPQNITIIDGKGKYLMPGLADMHTHLRHADSKDLLDYLRLGVTTMREMNGRPFILAWRDQIKQQSLSGPRLFVASPAIGNWSSPKEGYPTPQNEQEAKERVKQFKEAGYDFIKVYNFIPRDIYFAIIEAAKKHDIRVVGHLPLEVSLREAMQAGQYSLEHLNGYVETAWTPEGKAQDEQDNRAIFHAVPLNDAQVQQIAMETHQYGMWNCPTITFFDRVLPAPMVEKPWNDSVLRTLGLANRKKITFALHRAGAPLLFGTDSDAGDDLPATSIYDEFQYFIEAGLTPFEALQTATINAARFLNLEKDLGTVEEGKIADLLLLPCNPLEDIQCLKQLELVINNGKIFSIK